MMSHEFKEENARRLSQRNVAEDGKGGGKESLIISAKDIQPLRADGEAEICQDSIRRYSDVYTVSLCMPVVAELSRIPEGG